MTNPDSAEYSTQSTNLKTFNNILKKCIREAKKIYYYNLFLKFKSDIKGTWKTINDILNKTKKKYTFPSFFRDEENNIITDKLQIANKFNNFFASIGSNLARQIKSPTDKSFKNYLTKKHNHTFKFHDINEDTINSIIDKLSPKTSFGFDGLSTKLIKIVKLILVRPITIIVNQMLNTGVFPDKLKIAKINPIYKKDENFIQ